MRKVKVDKQEEEREKESDSDRQSLREDKGLEIREVSRRE